MSNVLTFSKIGSFFNRPDWRFYLLENPFDPFKPEAFKPHLRVETETERSNTFHGSYLKRFVDRSNPNSYRINTRLTEEGQVIYDSLSPEEQENFRSQFNIQLANEHLKHVTYTKDEKLAKVRWRWRLKYLSNIADSYFIKLIKHVTNVEFNKDIEEAIKYKMSENHDSIVKLIGYMIYLKISDREIAKTVGFKEKQIEALRYLFFDFSNAPKDTIGIAVYLRQLVNNNIVTEVDFNTFKIMNHLGKVGLKAKIDIKSLNEVELKFVTPYLRKGVVEKLFDLEQSARSTADARAFLLSANAFSNMQLEQDKLNYLKAREENERAKTKKIEGEMTSNAASVSTDAETLALVDQIYEETMRNNPTPSVKSLDDLRKD